VELNSSTLFGCGSQGEEDLFFFELLCCFSSYGSADVESFLPELSLVWIFSSKGKMFYLGFAVE
jgi:hypothetical protein